ncbi:putative nuclease of restriction endonuclease-like (RecB) superfamily [Paraburkholderia atlantica]|uniref:Putative nuclease of restriction endonuclease-like (RecB) superfamily n=1 Tax=Paraburkholderia youngii TaxID=2782701 RepID=A0A7W8P6A0_9BURK|nr:putative nuclease of restriction endonuclease-like (RecB) superfamily [Paraburkholderia youngii]
MTFALNSAGLNAGLRASCRNGFSPTEVIQQELSQLRDAQQLAPEVVLKDPYLLDFLGLNDRYFERDLEEAILREMEQFLLELGAGFTFVARQKRLQIDDDDFYLDLLFYNRS